jgi:hypothetical protein
MKLWQQKVLTFFLVVLVSFLFGSIVPAPFGQYVFLTIFVLGAIGSWEMTSQFWPSVRRWFRTTFGL